jgi:hypothetical protein
MANRYKWFSDVWVDKVTKGTEEFTVGHLQKGVPTTSLSTLFNFNDNLTYMIPPEFAYRPDLIAYKFYKDSKLFWILVYVNNFKNSPEDFIVGAVIKVPRFEKVLGRV